MGGKDNAFLVVFQNIKDSLRQFQRSSTDFWLFLGYAKTTKITRNQDLRAFAGFCVRLRGFCGRFAGRFRRSISHIASILPTQPLTLQINLQPESELKMQPTPSTLQHFLEVAPE